MMRKIFLSLIFFAGFSSAVFAVSENSGFTPALIQPPAPSAVHADDRDYLPAAERMIHGAQKSVDLSLDTVDAGAGEEDPVRRLIHLLMDNARKGVKVRIFLNTRPENQNELFFLRDDLLSEMRKDGIEVHYVSPKHELNDRLLIVDGEWVLEGGLPWRKEDLERGLGSATLSRSPELAEKKRIRLELLPLWDVEVKKRESSDGVLSVPVFLLRELKHYPGMVSQDDSDALKIHLALLRRFFATGQARATYMLEELGSEIPADTNFDREALKYQVLKTLMRLQENYGLFKIEKKEFDRVEGSLVLPSDLSPLSRVPMLFFQEGYARQLSARAIMAYIIIQLRSQASGDSPVWLGSETNVEQDFPMTRENFRLGVQELQARNLVEVFPFRLQNSYSRLEGMEYRYLINPILTLSEKLETWTRMREQFGDGPFDRAKELAEALGENEDPKVMAVYLDLMNRFPLENIQSFTRHVNGLPAQSTQQKLAYIKELLEHETRDTELAVF